MDLIDCRFGNVKEMWVSRILVIQNLVRKL